MSFEIMIFFVQYITVSAFFSQMININNRKDERISECFPNDPYSNICIVTTTQKLYLQHAFLSMDSGYFARIDPDARQVDLRELEQEPLVRTLHSLYGEELIANSMSELAALLPIILYLDIQQYRKNIEKEILSRKELIENVELIQVAFRHKFLWQQIIDIHIKSHLTLLENAKSYLQLGKIQNDTFNSLLLEYIQKTSAKNEKALNNVMENYFNRKGIKAIPYLQSSNLPHLLKIWANYHHAFQLLTPSTQMTSTTRQPEVKSHEIILLQKKNKIKKLEDQIASKDTAINKLMQDIKSMKNELGIKEKLGTARSLFIIPPENETHNSKDRPQDERRSKMSPQFKSCIYTEARSGEKRSSSKWKTFNRFGSKNIKRWA